MQAVPWAEGQQLLLELPFSPPFREPRFCWTTVLILVPAPRKKILHAEGLFFVPEYLSSEVSGIFLIKMLNILGSGTRCRRRITF